MKDSRFALLLGVLLLGFGLQEDGSRTGPALIAAAVLLFIVGAVTWNAES